MRSPTSRGHRYLTVVVDHDTGRLVWAAPGHDRHTLAPVLRPARSPSAARRSRTGQRRRRRLDRRRGGHSRCPHAVLLRRPLPRRPAGPPRRWTRSAARPGTRAARRAARPGRAAGPGAQGRPVRAVEEPRAPHRPPARASWPGSPRSTSGSYRAYLLKEEPAAGVQGSKATRASGAAGRVAGVGPPLPHPRLRRRSARSITRHRAAIQATLLHGLSNALVESVNTKIRLLTRIAFGFHSPQALIGLAMPNTPDFVRSTSGFAISAGRGSERGVSG